MLIRSNDIWRKENIISDKNSIQCTVKDRYVFQNQDMDMKSWTTSASDVVYCYLLVSLEFLLQQCCYRRVIFPLDQVDPLICRWRTRKKTTMTLCPCQSCWNWSWRSCCPSSSFQGRRRSSCGWRPWRRAQQAMRIKKRRQAVRYDMNLIQWIINYPRSVYVWSPGLTKK